jgi:predicted transposase YbfD/YdcC
VRPAAAGFWKVREETSFHAASTLLDAKTFADAIRKRRAIENQNREVTLAEDASRIRVNPGIIARLRRLNLNISKADHVPGGGVGAVVTAISR